MAYITSDWQLFDGEPDWDEYKPTECHVDLTAIYIVDVGQKSCPLPCLPIYPEQSPQ